MNWAMRLKRVFNIDVSICSHCRGNMRIIAWIEERAVIDKILLHIEQKQKSQTPFYCSSDIRAPPVTIKKQLACHYN
ncbi:hypothetical protein Lcin_3036 [Legionella cincinnatiensis]|uniref:Transposase n=2 Tax=Legionella cincinnatiensis TaxID=28085 RepID=A0ABR5QP68_9GAMM|nr:hypothetical protein Lcin_3036 [Legionella cincinnatiensis]